MKLGAIVAVLLFTVTAIAVTTEARPTTPDAPGSTPTGGALESFTTAPVGTMPVGDATAQANAVAWARAHPGELMAPGDNGEANEPPRATPTGNGGPMSPPPLATNAPVSTNGFDGQNNAVQGQNVVPPDMGMAVGPTYAVQFVNSAGGGAVAIYYKSNGTLATWVQYKSLFATGSQCAGTSHSDPNALYDSARDRYFLLDFTTASPENWCVAYSQSNDPLGSWVSYSAPINSCGSTFPQTDYEHSGVWIDGIYTATGMYSSSGTFQNAGVFVWNRDDMYNGTTMRCAYVSLPTLKTGTTLTEFRPDPANYNVNTGIPAAGTDEPTISLYNAGGGCTTCLAHIINVHTVWSTSGGTATLGTQTDLTVTALASLPPSTVTSTADKLDTLSYHSMQELQYYKSGSSEFLLVGRTTANRGATALGNPNWFEFTRNGGAWNIRQQAEYAPDTAISRIQPALAYDRAGNVVMDYTATSASVNPDLRYTGRLSTDTLNTMQTEATSKASGGGFQATCGGTCTRWGDYSDAKVDPDGCKIWFSMEYMPSTGLNWNTWIGATSFAPASCTTLTYGDSAPSSVSFGAVGTGSSSTPQTATITNTGTGPLVLQPVNKSGANAADFSVTNDTCSTSVIAAGGTCTMSVTFTPSATGSRAATLSVGTNVAAANKITITLSGTGASPPTTTASLSGTTGTNGWYRSAVSVTLTCTPVSPATCSSTRYSVDGGAQQTYSTPFTVSGDSASHVVTYASTDSNGATETTKTTTLKIDSTAPTFSLSSRLPAANANGWNNGNVVVTWACSDALSGVVAASVNATVSTEGASQTATSACTDLAGNNASVTQGGISIDKTAPTGVGSRSPAANAQGWSNVNVVASASCSDALSGIPTQPASSTVSTEGSSQSRSFTCTDAAGNTASVTVSGISIDKTAPTVSGSRSPAPNANGWNNVDVTASFTCSDALSGVLTAPSNVVLSSEGASQSATGTCTDNAGNSASATVSGVNIDKTAPTLATHADVSAEATSASGATVTYTAPAASDALSGVSGSVACAPASGGTFALGSATVSCSVSDLAGNSATSSFLVTVRDTTPPTISATADITAEATGASGAVVTYSSPATSDLVDGAGVASCSPASGSTFALGSTTVTCSATDAHGNSASATFVVMVRDTTPPALSVPADITTEATSASGAAATYSASASDLVDGAVSPSCAPASGSTFALGSTTVTCTATDAHGNAATRSFVVTVRDTTPPSIAAHADVSAEATSASGAAVTFDAPATSDLVDGSGVATCSPASGSTFAIGSTTVTCSATDAHGNAASSAFQVLVKDTSAPTVTVPAGVTVEATSASGAVATFTATAQDAVDGALTPTCSPASGATFALGATTVTCSATDSGGNTGSASFTVTVRDTTPPTISATDDITAEATGASGAVVTYSSPATSDLVDGAAVATCTPASGTTFALGSTTVTCSATDAHGNAASATFVVLVRDTTPPTVTVPAPMTLEATSASGAPATFTATASDLVDGAIAPACAPASGATFALGTTTVTCSATDAAGNTGSASLSVTVADTTPPTIATVSDITAEATSGSGAAVAYGAPSTSAMDLVDGAVTPVCSPTSGSTFALGSTRVTCTATDAHGNAASGSFVVTVRDTTPPALATHADVTAEATSASGASVAFDAPAASDLVDGALAASCAPASGSTFAIGSTTVTCTATDAHGNAATTSFLVKVADSSAPVIDAVADITQEATSASGAVVTFAAPATHDAVDGAGVASCAPASGSQFALGSTTVTCTATDSAGNTATPVSFTVKVQDTTAPTLSLPADATLEATSARGAASTFTASAADVVDGTDAVTCAPASGSTFPLGTTTVECSATDTAGNVAKGAFTVTVRDTTAPVIAAADDITAEATSASGATVTFAAPVTSDAVDGAGAASCSPASGSAFALGSTTVTCSATDAAGNRATDVRFTVKVQDTTAPTIAAVPDVTAAASGPHGATVTYAAPATSDAVDGAGAATCSPASGSVFALGATTVTCDAHDAAGNHATPVTFTVRVGDASAPTIDAHADVTAEATSASGAVVTYAAPATHDDVDGDGVATCAPASGSAFALGATTVTCRATDAAGNAATPVGFTVKVQDTTAPVIASAADITSEATSPRGAAVTYAAPSTSDAVDGAGSATCSPASGATFALGSTTVTCAATDAAGNAATPVAFVVTVRDTTAPVIAAASDVTAEATGASGAVVDYASPATSDAVDGAGVATCSPASGAAFALGATTVTCRATDAAGNAATPVSFTVKVQDTTAPVIATVEDIKAAATDGHGAVVQFDAPATTDAVDGAGVATCSPASGSLFPLGATTVRCDAQDSAGNRATPVSFTVRVGDVQPPTIDAHADVTAEATGPSGASVEYAAPATHDNVDGDGVATCAPASGSTFALGSTTVTCTATDAAGNTASSTFAVKVADTTAPAIAPVADITAEATGPDGAVVAYEAPATRDAVDGNGVASCAPASGGTFPLGSTTVACSATDAAGNVARSSFVVKVVDTTPPLVRVPSGVTAEATSASGAAVTFASSATDAVSGDLPTSCSPASGSTFPLGESTVRCSAKDAAGNAGSASFTVRVVDTTAPTIDAVRDITAEATGADGATVSFTAPATHDAVDGDGTATCAPASGATFALGATRVTCTATDAAGNAATPVAFVVRVVDTTPPTLKLPADIAVPATSPDGAVVSFAATASDVVDGSVPVTCAPASGSTFARGATTVACSATDAAGNAASGSFVVRVVTQVNATVAMDEKSYSILDTLLGNVTGKVHVAFPGGVAASGANVTLTITRVNALGVLDSESFGGVTDAKGDFAFSADLAWKLPGDYTLSASADWRGVHATESGAYSVGILPAAGVASKLASASLLP